MQGISVVIPAFGRVAELRRAIGSVATAHPERTEIVVVDDHSVEPLLPLLPERTDGGVPIRVVRLTRNRGAGVARSIGIRRARFDYVSFLDSDDTFSAEKIDLLFERIRETSADIIFHQVEGADLYNRLMARWDRSGRRVLPFHWLIVLLNPIPTPSLTIRRRRRLGHPTLRHAEDWAFLLRYVDPATQVDYIPRVLASIHRSIGSAGGLSAARAAMREGEFVARRLLLRKPTLGNIARYMIGSAVGITRLAADHLRRIKGSGR